jgi:hypothetical protein
MDPALSLHKVLSLPAFWCTKQLYKLLPTQKDSYVKYECKNNVPMCSRRKKLRNGFRILKTSDTVSSRSNVAHLQTRKTKRTVYCVRVDCRAMETQRNNRDPTAYTRLLPLTATGSPCSAPNIRSCAELLSLFFELYSSSAYSHRAFQRTLS